MMCSIRIHVAIMCVLLTRCAQIVSMNKCVSFGNPLHNAIMHHDMQSVKRYIHQGADVNARALQGKTPLHVAAMYNCVGVISVLVFAGAKNKKDSTWKKYPIHDAIDNGHIKLIEELMRNGASPNVMSRLGSPLHLIAGQLHSVTMAKILRDYGASINCQRRDGCTPLHQASFYNDVALT